MRALPLKSAAVTGATGAAGATGDVAPRPAAPATVGASLVEARGLCVRQGRRELLHGVNMAVREGEIVTVIGPNGAGKSTLAKALLGILRPAAGEVWQRPGLRAGYLPQRLHVDPTLPLRVERFLTLGGASPRDAVARVLAEVGATHLARAQLSALSGGELQRVLMARALVRDPQLLILDEPVQGVDVAGQLELYRLIAEIRRAHGCGVLLISHDLHLVMSATDRVVCLNRHVCCAGRPEAVLRDPAYLNLFGPAAAERLAVYAHAHTHDHHHDHGQEDLPHP